MSDAKTFFATALLVLVASGCSLLEVVPSNASTQRDPGACPLPPPDIGMNDLAGTWELRGGPIASDVIELRSDGTFRQTIEVGTSYSYESPWRSWTLETHPDGTANIHLDQMRYCDGTDEQCMSVEGGAGDELLRDPCRQLVVRMEGEVVLSVLGTEGSRNPYLEQAPRGLALMHMSGDGDSTTSWYVLQADNQ